jgi:hypothetical protein
MQNERNAEMVYTDAVFQYRGNNVSRMQQQQQYAFRPRYRPNRAGSGHSSMPYVAGLGPVLDAARNNAVCSLRQYADGYERLSDEIVKLCVACRLQTLQHSVIDQVRKRKIKMFLNVSKLLCFPGSCHFFPFLIFSCRKDR